MIFFNSSVKLFFLALIITPLIAACSTPADPVKKAEASISTGQYEEGLSSLDKLAKKEPASDGARAALMRNRSAVAERLMREAKIAIETDRLLDANNIYNRLLALDPGNSLAKKALRNLTELNNRQTRYVQAEELFRGGDMPGAERQLQGILLEQPSHKKAIDLMRKIAARQLKNQPSTLVLGPEFKKIISLEFNEANLKDVFDAIWHSSGVNFILDRDIRRDSKTTILIKNVTIEEAIDALLMSQQLTKKIVNSKTLFIYQKTPQKISEYQDLVVRNFFLAYADAKQLQSMLKTILKTKEVFVDEKRNLLVVRDNQEAVDMAEKLIQAHDQAEPEVMLAIDVIEVKRSKLSELGLSLPSQIALGVGNPITLQALSKLGPSGINVGIDGVSSTLPGAIGALNLKNTDGVSNMLANPRIRVRNREKAKIHIGDRLPIVTTNMSTTANVSTQNVTYLDVGLKLEVEPQVMLDDDVVVKVNLEVSTATQSTVNKGFYDIGTRNTSTVLTIRDGETQVLAGLIRDEERSSSSRLPGLGDIPILGRLFANELNSSDKTEIILAITPVVLHNLLRPSAELTQYSTGTESGQRAAAGAAIAAPTAQTSGTQAPVAPNIPPQSGSRFQRGRNFSAPFSQPNQPASTSTVAPQTNTPPANDNQSSGVIPMIDFQPPPGAGSSPHEQ